MGDDYGYAPVSTEGQSVAALTDTGAAKIFEEAASGAKTDRAQVYRLLNTPDEATCWW